MKNVNITIRLILLGALICLVLYLGIGRPIEKIAKAVFPTAVSHSPKYPKTVEDLKLLGTWTLEKHEFDRLIPQHPLLKLYYKERNGWPVVIEAVEWRENKFKLWNGVEHNVFYQEKHKRHVIKDAKPDKAE